MEDMYAFTNQTEFDMAVSPQRQSRLYAIQEHMKSHCLLLREEINLFLDNPVGVAGHADYFKSIEDKIRELAEYEGAVDILENL